MNRRDALRALLAGGTIGAAGLWTPARSIFLPPRGGWDLYAIRQRVSLSTDHLIVAELPTAPPVGSTCSFNFDGSYTTFSVDGVLVPHRLNVVHIPGGSRARFHA